MENIQAFVDGLSAQWQRERGTTQMTLGELISALEKLQPGAEVTGLNRPHSYRGYYEDLAFEPTDGKVSAASLLDDCRGVMGKILVGYKGGNFVMGELTPVWCSTYGTSSGLRLMAMLADGTIEMAAEE